MFIATVSNGEVTIRTANEILTLPSGVTRVVLELHAGDARAVLILTVIESGNVFFNFIDNKFTNIYCNVMNFKFSCPFYITCMEKKIKKTFDLSYRYQFNDKFEKLVHLNKKMTCFQKSEKKVMV